MRHKRLNTKSNTACNTDGDRIGIFIMNYLRNIYTNQMLKVLKDHNIDNQVEVFFVFINFFFSTVGHEQ